MADHPIPVVVATAGVAAAPNHSAAEESPDPNPAAVEMVAERVAGVARVAVDPNLAAGRVDDPNHSGSWIAEMPPFQPLQQHT